MQAELVGFSLAVAPGKACYVPLGHRAGVGELRLRRRRRHRSRSRSREALGAAEAAAGGRRRPQDRAEHQVRLRCVLARHGIDVAPLDDTMLISYALDGGRGGHGMDDLAERHLGHTCMPFDAGARARAGRQEVRQDLRAGAARQGDRVCRRGRRRHAAAVDGAEAAAGGRAHDDGLRDAGAAAGAGPRRHGARRHQGRPARSCRGCRRRSRSASRGSRRRSTSSPATSSTSARRKQLGEFLFDSLKLPGGKQTKTGQWETRAGLLDDLAANEELPDDARKLINAMLEWRQLTKLSSTYTDALPQLHQSGRPGRIHTCYALGCHHDRPARLDRPQPAEHPDPHQGRPRDPHGLHRRAGQQADLGRLQPDRAARAGPHRRHPAAEGRPSTTASTSTP